MIVIEKVAGDDESGLPFKVWCKRLSWKPIYSASSKSAAALTELEGFVKSRRDLCTYLETAAEDFAGQVCRCRGYPDKVRLDSSDCPNKHAVVWALVIANTDIRIGSTQKACSVAADVLCCWFSFVGLQVKKQPKQWRKRLKKLLLQCKYKSMSDSFDLLLEDGVFDNLAYDRNSADPRAFADTMRFSKDRKLESLISMI